MHKSSENRSVSICCSPTKKRTIMLEFSTLYFTFIMMYVSFSVFLSLCFSFILQAHTFLEATGAGIHSILMRVVYQLELSSFLCQLLTATTVFLLLLVLCLLMGKRKFIWTTDQKSKCVAPAACTYTHYECDSTQKSY